jgi:peptidoglycan/LPS O-acetylase OafA/YrhL
MEANDAFRAPGEPRVLILVLGFFFLLMYAVAVGKTARFELKKFAGLGALTYPLYLLHQNLGYIVLARFEGHVEKHVLLVGLTCLMIAAAYGVHRSIECRFGPRLRVFLDRIGRPRIAPALPV